MTAEIQTLSPGGVNSYLLESKDGFILVDTSISTARAKLEKELASTGCPPGNLKLIILTHGDVDHCGNAAYLRDKYGADIAMHHDDAEMVKRGDMSWNRKPKPDRLTWLGKLITNLSSVMFRSMRLDPFTPDRYFEDGTRLSQYGSEAIIVHLPGHSRGSIGILTGNGNLISGDLFMNMFKPDFHFFIDDLSAARASVAKLLKLDVKTVYPAHGKPFLMEQLGNAGR